MPVELSELMQLALKQRPHLFMGELPRSVAEYLKANPGLVYLGCREFYKIGQKHTEITREEFQSIPHLIKSGSYYSVPDRPNCATIFGYATERNLMYQIGIKATDNGGEVWVQTFHRTTELKAGRIKSRCQRIVGF